MATIRRINRSTQIFVPEDYEHPWNHDSNLIRVMNYGIAIVKLHNMFYEAGKPFSCEVKPYFITKMFSQSEQRMSIQDMLVELLSYGQDKLVEKYIEYVKY